MGDISQGDTRGWGTLLPFGDPVESKNIGDGPKSAWKKGKTPKMGPNSYLAEPIFISVGGTGIEPVTSSVSGKRSPAELTARDFGAQRLSATAVPDQMGNVSRFAR